MTSTFGLYRIVATHAQTGELYECMTWQGSPQDGIEHAKAMAAKVGRQGELTDYRAQPLNGQRCVGCGD